MKKIPCIFKRNFEKGKPAVLISEINPECEWLLHEEAVIYEKLDGTACMIQDGVLFKRYDRKFNKKTNDFKDAPVGWEPCEEIPDVMTKHWPGWVPVDDSPADQWHREAFIELEDKRNGTYELIGCKINGNPYKTLSHQLIHHEGSGVWVGQSSSFSKIGFLSDWHREIIEGLMDELHGKTNQDFTPNWDILMASLFIERILELVPSIEGFIFRNENGEMAKIRRKDFGLEWPVKST